MTTATPHKPRVIIDDSIRLAIRTGVADGYSYSDIAQILGLSGSCVASIARQMGIQRDTGPAERQYDPTYDGAMSVIARRWKQGKTATKRRRMPENIVIKSPPEFQDVARPLRRLGYVVFPLDNDGYGGWYHCGPKDVTWKQLCRLSRKAERKLKEMKK